MSLNWLRLPYFGLYIHYDKENKKVLCSAINRHGLPEEDEHHMNYRFYEIKWRYTKRDFKLMEIINHHYGLNLNLRKETNASWYQLMPNE